MTEVIQRIKIIKGQWRTIDAAGAIVDQVKEFDPRGWVTILGTPFLADNEKIRVKLFESGFEVVPPETPISPPNVFTENSKMEQAFLDATSKNLKNIVLEGDVDGETEAETIARINERFEILDELTLGVIEGHLKGLVVAGAPGVGKSFLVEGRLQKNSMLDLIAGKKANFEIIKGRITPIMLYMKLHEYAGADQVAVFDDCDNIFLEGDSLNMLKAALDSSKRRFISYNTAASILEKAGVPPRFEFKGTVIFITNLKPENTRSDKIRAHIEALYDRVLNLDLTIDTPRDRFLRVKSMIMNSQLLEEYAFDDDIKDSIIDFLRQNVHRLKGGISLRTALNISNLIRMKPDGWEYLARNTLLKRGGLITASTGE